MNAVTIEKYFTNLTNNECRFYDKDMNICLFPNLHENISMSIISDRLKSFVKYVTKKESYEERLEIRTSEDWKLFANEMRKEKNYTCEISNYSLKDIRELNQEIFHISMNQSNVNNWLNIHHISGEYDYECYDKSKLLVVNRAIHMTLHMYENLLPFIPNLKDNYRLWFELGALCKTNDGKYPWQNLIGSN